VCRGEQLLAAIGEHRGGADCLRAQVAQGAAEVAGWVGPRVEPSPTGWPERAGQGALDLFQSGEQVYGPARLVLL
jgi:hypothetical protein